MLSPHDAHRPRLLRFLPPSHIRDAPFAGGLLARDRYVPMAMVFDGMNAAQARLSGSQCSGSGAYGAGEPQWAAAGSGRVRISNE